MFNLNMPYQTREEDPVVLSVSELAEYLGIGRNKAYDLLREDIIKGFKIGCTWKVSKAAVDKYIYEKSGLL